MKKILIALVVFAGVACGQQNTVFQALLSNSTTLTQYVTANVRNIGQQYHRVDIYSTSNACNGGATAGNAGIAYIEGSTDNISFVPISPEITSLAYYQPLITTPYKVHTSITASGAFAYIRLSIFRPFFALSDSTICPLYAFYSGSITGTLSSSQPFTATNDTFSYATGALTTTSQTPVATCNQGTSIQIYEVALSAVGGANTANLQGPNLGSGVYPWAFKVGLPAASPNWSLQQGPRPHFFMPGLLPSSYVMNITPSAATELDYSISYRCE